MAKYKGKYYKVDLVKANHEYKCDITKKTICKGEHYLNLQIEIGPEKTGRSIYSYTPTETLHISKIVLATRNMEEILDATGRFRSKEEKLVQLYADNQRLARANIELKQKLKDCQETVGLKRRLGKIFTGSNKPFGSGKMSLDCLEIGDSVSKADRHPFEVTAIYKYYVRLACGDTMCMKDIAYIWKPAGETCGFKMTAIYEVEQ